MENYAIAHITDDNATQEQMYHEDDKRTIPENYLQMSLVELRTEKERLLRESKKQVVSKEYAKKTNKVGNITFKF